MLKNASLLAIVAVDTAENEPSEVGAGEVCQLRKRRGASMRSMLFERALTSKTPATMASKRRMDPLFGTPLSEKLSGACSIDADPAINYETPSGNLLTRSITLAFLRKINIQDFSQSFCDDVV